VAVEDVVAVADNCEWKTHVVLCGRACLVTVTASDVDILRLAVTFADNVAVTGSEDADCF